MTALGDAAGLPTAPVRRWLERVIPDSGENDTWSAELISGGLSNLTYRVQRGADRFIIRRPPLTRALPRAHDMLREYRVLTALAQTRVPVPGALAFCDDTDVAGAPFYVMREVDGSVLRTPADTAALSVGQRTRLSEHLIDVLAELHAVDVDAVGLGDFGRRGGYAARQLRTWSDQWRRSRTRDIPDMERLIERLSCSLPGADEITVVHGDYRLDNTIVLLEPSARVAAVLDWELSTLGDPVFDLATLLTYWHDLHDDERGRVSVAAGLTSLPGFPTTAELAQRYATVSGRDLALLDYALAFAAMKLAVILEGVHTRYLTGMAVGDGYADAGAGVRVLAARGLRLLGG